MIRRRSTPPCWGGPGLLDYPQEGFRGLYEVLSRPLPRVKAIKGQVTGPISCGLQVFDQNGKSAIYDDVYGEIIRKNLNMCARWQERELRERADNVILFLDEPSLSLVGTPFAPIGPDKVVEWIDEVLHGLSCVKGIHCCGNTDWPMVLSTDIDLLSFDAYSYAFSIVLYPKELKAFLDRGGVLSWGIVPNMDTKLAEESVRSLLDRFEKGVEGLVAKGLDRGTILRQSLLTPQCGLGGLDEEESRAGLASPEPALRMRSGTSTDWRSDMTYIVAVAGKGGVGKTTISALIVSILAQRSGELVLAIDADPNSNLGERLGVKVESTIGGLREDLLKNADELPPGSKHEMVRYQLELAKAEGEGFDLLTMGRPKALAAIATSTTCCAPSSTRPSTSYPYVVIDNEAGMEHLSRRTTKRMDVLVVVSDATKVGLETAVRILRLAEEMEIETRRRILVVNRSPIPLPPIWRIWSGRCRSPM